MCILFAHSCRSSSAARSGYSLIIANNRDEFFNRPTKEAHFWDTCNDVIGGADLQPGRSQGTWLAFSKRGRFASLLNILLPNIPLDDSKKGRGHLAVDYASSDVNSEEFLGDVYKHREEYNSFNLVVGERKSDGHWDFGELCTVEDKPPVFGCSKDTVAVSNHPLTKPWQKVLAGNETFSRIVAEYNDTSKKSQLQSKLLDLLNDRTCNLPDPVLEAQSEGRDAVPGFITKRSAVFVSLPEINYGTRTNTVILVEWSGHVTYLERTMVGNMDGEDWVTKEHQFDLDRRPDLEAQLANL